MDAESLNSPRWPRVSKGGFHEAWFVSGSDAKAGYGLWLRYGEAAREVVLGSGLATSDEEQLSALVEENVVTQLEHLKTHPAIAARLARRNLQLYGLVYSIHTGEISAYDAGSERFVSVDGKLASATPRVRSAAARKEVA